MRTAGIILIALVSACNNESLNVGAPIPIEQFADEYRRANCAAFLNCSGRLKLYFGDVEHCIRDTFFSNYLTTLAEMPVATLVQRVRSGALRYDPVAARACIEQVVPACGRTAGSGTPAACRRAFAGTAALGSPCFVSADCAGDAWCSTSGDRGSICPGVCTAHTALGMPCTRDAECPISSSPDTLITCAAVTRTTNGWTFCLAIRVDGPSGLGQPCGRRLVGTEEHATACAAGLWCKSRVCRAPIAAGEACTSEFDECVGGFCVGPLMGPKRCVTVTVQQTPGATCHVDVSDLGATQSICDNARDLACMGAICAAVNTVGAGRPCGSMVNRCALGLSCDTRSSTCVIPGPEGATCISDAACRSGACDTTTGTCRTFACE